VVSGDEPRLRSRLLVPWGEQLPLEVAEIGPRPGTSYFVTPGPQQRPARPFLEPSAAPDGSIAARVVGGDRSPRGQVVLVAPGGDPRVVTLASAPLAVAAGDDDRFWALHGGGQLVQHGADGGAIRSLPSDAVVIVPGRDGAVWAVKAGEALLIDGGGRELARVPWTDRVGSAPAPAGALAALDRDGSLRLLEGDGASAGAGTLEPPTSPHERLLAAGADAVLTAVGAGVRRRRGGAALEQLPLQAAGLSVAGEPWISGRAGEALVELRREGGASRYELDAAPAEGALRAVAVDDGAVTIIGPADVWRFAGGEPSGHELLDEARLNDDVFPIAWELTALAGTSSGTVLAAASGPAGVALVELSWPAVP
jgi:hypothetical protein